MFTGLLFCLNVFGVIIGLFIVVTADVNNTRVTFLKSPNARVDKLFLNLPAPGYGSERAMHSTSAELRLSGDFVDVSYGGEEQRNDVGFDPEQTAKVVCKELDWHLGSGKYKTLVIFGTSVGARVADLVAEHCKSREKWLQVKLVATDAFLRLSDLTYVARLKTTLVLVSPFVFGLNFVYFIPSWGRAFMRFAFVMPGAYGPFIHNTHNEYALYDHSISLARKTPLMFYWGQVRTMFRSSLSRYKWSPGNVAIIQSDNHGHGVVRGLASSWRERLGFIPPIQYLPAGYAGLARTSVVFKESWPKVLRSISVDISSE